MMRCVPLLLLILLLSSCGGGGNNPASLNYFIDPNAVQADGKDVSPYSTKPVDPKVFTITGGTPPFTISSQVVRGTQNALPTIVMNSDGRSFTVTPPQVNTETVISITATDDGGQKTSSTLTVEVPVLSVTTGAGGTSTTVSADGSVTEQLFITGGTPSSNLPFYTVDYGSCGNLVQIIVAEPFSFFVKGANNGTGSCTIAVTDSSDPVQTASVNVTVQ